MAADTPTRDDAFASLSQDGQPGQKTMATPPPTPPELLPASSDAMRLSMLAPTRLLLGSLASTMIGFMLGGFQGGQMAQLRFRAEHAHKMPDTTTGWYFYHKTKNYHAMQGGIREGFRMGAKTGFWSFAALSLETTVDRMRGCSDMLSTIVATVSVAGMFSLTHRFSLSAAARTARYGLLFGILYGVASDKASELDPDRRQARSQPQPTRGSARVGEIPIAYIGAHKVPKADAFWHLLHFDA